MDLWLVLSFIGGALFLISQRVDASTFGDPLPVAPPTDDPSLAFDPWATTIDMNNTGFPSTTIDLAMAIAHAEGFYVPGTVPNRAHNPLDLKIPHWTGPVTGAENISVFADDVTGWGYAYRQIQLIADGRSAHYRPALDTFATMGRTWTDSAQSAWVNNVVEYLQTHGYSWVTADTLLGVFFANG